MPTLLTVSDFWLWFFLLYQLCKYLKNHNEEQNKIKNNNKKTPKHTHTKQNKPTKSTNGQSELLSTWL